MKLQSVCFFVVFAILFPTRVFAYAPKTVGIQRCGSCHVHELEQWLQGPHARAHLSLSSAERDNIRCNVCHDDARLDSSKEDLVAVGVHCETCHGAGEYYSEEYIMRDRDLTFALGLQEQNAGQCQRCHTEDSPSLRAFDFRTMWEKIQHGVIAKEQGN